MRNIWTEYLTIKGGDFPAWWASLSLEEKREWQNKFWMNNYKRKRMARISEHVSYKEGVHSNTAVRRGFENIPTPDQLRCMQDVARLLFEPLREWVEGPIKVNSFFRGEPTNTAIGGSKTSQHMKGQAMDIDDTFGHKTNAEMFHYIKDNLDFDQMVWEFGSEYPDGNPNWIHISFVTHRKNRKKLTIAETIKGKTKYRHINA